MDCLTSSSRMWYTSRPNWVSANGPAKVGSPRITVSAEISALSASGAPSSTSSLSAPCWLTSRRMASWVPRSMAPDAVQTKHSVAENTTSLPAALAQVAMAGPATPSRSPRAITNFPSNTGDITPLLDPAWFGPVGAHPARLLRAPDGTKRSGPLVAFHEDAHPVGGLRHSSQEQAPLSNHMHARGPAAGEPPEGVGQVAESRRQVSLGRGEAGHPSLCDEIGHVLPGDLPPPDRQRGQGLVVALRDVAGALGLGDLRVVQLGGVVVDVQHAEPQGLERLHPEGLHDLGVRRPRPDPVPSHAVEAEPGRRAVVGGHQGGRPAEDVLQHGEVAAQVALELHAQLGERPAAD